MFSKRALLKIQIKRAFVGVLRRAYQHERIATLSYRVLANQQLDCDQRSLILQSARISSRKAHHYAVRLGLLRTPITHRNLALCDRLLYWYLIHCNVSQATMWIEQIENRDNDELDSLFSVKEFWH